MTFHAKCERCGKYEQAPDVTLHSFPVLPEKWQRLVMHEDRTNDAVGLQIILCPSCSGDVWGGIEGQMKHRARPA